MSGLDRSGPEGRGPSTGRQRGLCRRLEPEGTAVFGRGRGMGRGLGLGRNSIVSQNEERSQESGASATNVTAKTAGDEPAAAAELVSLKKHYREAVELLDAMAERIAVLEAKK